MDRRILLGLFTLSAVMFVTSVVPGVHGKRENYMNTMPPQLKRFSLSDAPPECASWKATMPKVRDVEYYRIYITARNFWRSKIEWEFTRNELERVLRDVERAANGGDWGARALLAYFYLRGLGPLDTNRVLEPAPEKAVQIYKAAVDAGQAWGYYDLGVAYENGYGDLPYDPELAWSYYRRAAELGSPEAQMALADAYRKAKKRNESDALMTCAYRQGHGPAALQLGSYAEVHKDLAAAIRYYQSGTTFGNEQCAAALMLIFGAEEWSGMSKDDQQSMKRANILPDPERSRRYREIADVLKVNPDLKLRRLEQVVPLPPADLPPWEGVQSALDRAEDDVPAY